VTIAVGKADKETRMSRRWFRTLCRLTLLCSIVISLGIGTAKAQNFYTYQQIDTPAKMKCHSTEVTAITSIDSSTKISYGGTCVDAVGTVRSWTKRYTASTPTFFKVPPYPVRISDMSFRLGNHVLSGEVGGLGDDLDHGWVKPFFGPIDIIEYADAGHIEHMAINDANGATGSYQDLQGRWRGFLYNRSSQTIISLIDVPGADETIPLGISNDWEIVGTALFLDAYIYRGFLRRDPFDPAGTYEFIGCPDGSHTWIADMNRHDQLLVRCSPVDEKTLTSTYVYDLRVGTWSLLSVPMPSGVALYQTIGARIDDQGRVGGWFDINDGTYSRHGFIARPAPAVAAR
jgi:hypothetical protein